VTISAKAERPASPAQQPWRYRWLSHGLVLLACLVPSVLLGLQGLSRPYDAIPDQDLLWASEALRIIRGVAPSYADHPGAFWTLVYRLNIDIASWLSDTAMLDQSGRITPQGIELTIKTARLQNAVVTGACAYLLYPAGWAIGIPQRIAAAVAAIFGLSSATLVSVSEIRHEAISLAFLTLSLITFAVALSQQRAIIRRCITVLSISFFFCAGFSKNQSLLLTPLLLLAFATAAAVHIPNSATKLAEIKRIPTGRMMLFVVISSIPWLVSAAPDIDLINLPIWILINSGLTIAICLGWTQRFTFDLAMKSLTGLGAAEILLFKALTPQWWRQAVTGFPSWMFRYTHASEHPASDLSVNTLAGMNRFFENQFIPPTLSNIAFWVCVAGSVGILIRRLCSPSRETSPTTLVVASAWVGCGLMLFASSQRVPITPRYDLYVFAPLLLTAATSWAHYHTKKQTFSSERQYKLLAISCSLIILGCGVIRSIDNVDNIGSFLNPAQSRDNVCIGHHMDRSMQLTSAGLCKDFPKGARDKDIYDPWWGPKG